MTKRITALLLALTVAVSTHAQLVPKDAKPEKVADGYKFTEGPALAPDGSIYFTDIPAELILRFDPETGETKTAIENSGQANGLVFYRGALYFCAHKTRMVGVIENNESLIVAKGKDEPPYLGKTYPICKTYDGKKLNSPNDIAIDKYGNFYFTDPRYGNRDSMEMKVEGVYVFNRMRIHDAKEIPNPPKNFLDPKRIDDELTRPNGIVLSPDEKILYVADNAENWIYAYDIVKPGEVKNKRKFARLNDGKGGGSDGMCVDQQGRLYATGHGKVWVFEPTGQLVATIDVGKQTTNCTFGKDGKTLYITANKGLYRIKLNTDAKLEHAKKVDKVELKLPADPKAEPDANNKRAILTLSLSDPDDADSSVVIELDKVKIDIDDVEKKLAERIKQDPNLTLLLRVTTNIKWKQVVGIYNQAAKAGVKDIHFGPIVDED